MAALARWCFQRRAWVLVGWLALLVILGVTGRAAGSAYSDTLTLPGTGSTAALHPGGTGVPRARRGPGHDRVAGQRRRRTRSGGTGPDHGHAGQGRRRARGGLGDQPVLGPRRRPGQPRRADRLRHRGLRRPGEQPARAGGHPRRPPRRGGPGPRPAGRPGRAGGGERAAALGRHQRGRRGDRRGGGAVHRVRLAAGHAAAAGGRDRRAGLRPDDGRAGLARGQHSPRSARRWAS